MVSVIVIVMVSVTFVVAGELDCHLQPVGKEMFVCEEEEQWDEEEDEGVGQARPGTTKRKQYYIKKVGMSVKCTVLFPVDHKQYHIRKVGVSVKCTVLFPVCLKQ